jgi:8-oxo-dGTP pyrophosphatase MutT (NUDIX family)
VLVLATAYALGIIIDRIADSTFRQFNETRVGRLNNRLFGEGSEGWVLPGPERAMRTTVMHAGGGMAAFLDYQRSRIRVVRGTAVNALIGAVVAGVYFASQGRWGALVSVDAILVCVFLVSIPVAERIRAAWLKGLRDAYRKIIAADDAEQLEEGVVAAVPYARTKEGLRFLIVRTTGGKRWTFPKGHVKEGESDHDAALRELKEEAGVEGIADAEPFAAYRYPPTRKRARSDSLVWAFLVEIVDDTTPAGGEAGRDPGWLSPTEAAEKLAEHRDPVSAAEHARVIDQAVRRIRAS